MSQISVDQIVDVNGGNAVQINGMTPTAESMQGFRNRIINGDMRIDQRNAGASVAIATSDIYTLDRWQASVQGSGTGRFSVQRSTVAPTGFTNSTLITVTTADASPSAGFGYHFHQPIEGFNVADFALGSASAIQFTISFWVRSSVTGTFPFLLSDANLARYFGGTYTIISANTWEQKFVTVTGDTTGTWETGNTVGLRLQFGFGGGSSRTVSTGWQAGNNTYRTNVTGATQLIATNGATFYITGVQLEAGSVATPFERRPYGAELALCQRYFQTSNGTSAFILQAFFTSAQFKVSMRATPSITISPTPSAVGVNTEGFQALYSVQTGASFVATAEL